MNISSELIDKYRYINVEHEWWDCIESDLWTEMKCMGFHVDKLFFSGFCSQGDGASFIGDVDNLELFIKECVPHFDKEYPLVRQMFDTVSVSMVQGSNRRYSHENTVLADVNAESFGEQVGWSAADLVIQAADALDEVLDEQLDSFQADVQTVLRDKMQDTYKKLNDTYDYLTSDEQVEETIISCELGEDE
jgi:hypothetical protein